MLPSKRYSKTTQKGQALIMLLLAMSVVVTVLLSSVSRSVTEVKVTSYEEEALRAFSAAEAGVEEKLLSPGVGSFSGTIDSSTSYSGNVVEKNITGDTPGKQLIYPKTISAGETATFYLCPQDTSGQFFNDASSNPCWHGSKINVCYGSGSTPEPALEVSVYYDDTSKSIASPNDYSDLKIYRAVFDSGGRIIDADPANASCTYDDGTSFDHKAVIKTSDIPMPSGSCSSDVASAGCAILVKVRMLYADNQPLGFWVPSGSGINIPAQGVLISSTGTSGESSRKVDVYQGRSESLSLFDLSIFSLKGLTK